MLIEFAFRSQNAGLQHPLCFSPCNLSTKTYANIVLATNNEKREISQDCDEWHRIHRKIAK